jgi:hypothetical protein
MVTPILLRWCRAICCVSLVQNFALRLVVHAASFSELYYWVCLPVWHFAVLSGVSEIFCTHPDRSWSSPSPLYNGYRFCLPGVKRPGHGVYHLPSSSAEVKERVELHLHFPLCLHGTLQGEVLFFPPNSEWGIILLLLMDRFLEIRCKHCEWDGFPDTDDV